MLKIKLARTGKKNAGRYRIVVAERRSKQNGRFIDLLGYYLPQGNKILKLNRTKLDRWLKLGAQPTESVKLIIKKNGSVA